MEQRFLRYVFLVASLETFDQNTRKYGRYYRFLRYIFIVVSLNTLEQNARKHGCYSFLWHLLIASCNIIRAAVCDRLSKVILYMPPGFLFA